MNLDAKDITNGTIFSDLFVRENNTYVEIQKNILLFGDDIGFDVQCFPIKYLDNAYKKKKYRVLILSAHMCSSLIFTAQLLYILIYASHDRS